MRPRGKVLFVVVLSAALGLGALSGAAGADDGIQCGSVITEDTVLTHDLVGCENGLVIGVPNVTLDLGGHVIVGRGADTGVGVTFVEQQTAGSVVKNGAIRSFKRGVSFSTSAKISNLEISLSDIGVLGNFLGDPSGHAQATIEKSTIHDNGVGIVGTNVDGRGDFQIANNRISLNTRGGISASDWWPLLIQGNLVSGNGGTGVRLFRSHARVLDNTFDRNAFDGLSIEDFNHSNFFRVGGNLARGNGNLGMSVNKGFPPDSSDLLDAGGNGASRNGDPQECTPNLVCASNRGQADKLTPLTADATRHS
jgi:hypothetical protein